MACDAAIRPLSDKTIEIRCEVEEHLQTPGTSHQGVLRDYAYPGSATTITWMESDRRSYHGDWPGLCAATRGCLLPDLHRGMCAT